MKKLFYSLGIACVILVFAGGCEKQFENYEKGTKKAKQLEAELNLQSLAIAQFGFRAANRRYGSTFSEIGFDIVGSDQRYSYFMGKDVLEGALGPGKLPDSLSLPKVSKDSFIAYAVANLDADPDLDVWRVDQNKSVQHLHNDR